MQLLTSCNLYFVWFPLNLYSTVKMYAIVNNEFPDGVNLHHKMWKSIILICIVLLSWQCDAENLRSQPVFVYHIQPLTSYAQWGVLVYCVLLCSYSVYGIPEVFWTWLQFALHGERNEIVEASYEFGTVRVYCNICFYSITECFFLDSCDKEEEGK
jgi:hypothetical protein